MNCYCHSSLKYTDCCFPFVSTAELPQTPEQLMRSRYSAYVIKNAEYIFQTYHSSKRSALSIESLLEWANSASFIKLEIVNAKHHDKNNIGEVEFIASFIENNTLCQLHERSNFVREDGQWRYVDGELFDKPEVKIARNDTCPCGSGKKFKKCHAS